ncbi:hypothetical protein [Lonepinella sp. BR2882]|uniref:hypothetical protein n=1 Tax=Lonepinella sp. BR2882 TaxID=3095283 RepID=UPI003F6DCB19
MKKLTLVLMSGLAFSTAAKAEELPENCTKFLDHYIERKLAEGMPASFEDEQRKDMTDNLWFNKEQLKSEKEGDRFYGPDGFAKFCDYLSEEEIKKKEHLLKKKGGKSAKVEKKNNTDEIDINFDDIDTSLDDIDFNLNDE